MHVLILGKTGSGKTTLALSLIAQYKQSGIESLVLDPLGDPRYGVARYVTRDPFLYMRAARLAQSCALFVDESGEAIGQHNDEMFWLATRARHLGHTSHFLAQRAAQIAPTVRDQCEMLVAFKLSYDDAKTLAREWSAEELVEVGSPAWPRLDYLAVRSFGATTRGTVAIGPPPALSPSPAGVDPASGAPTGSVVPFTAEAGGNLSPA